MNDRADDEPARPADAEDLGRSYRALFAAPQAAAEPEAPPPPHRILEAMLFMGGEPLTERTARSAIRGLSAEQFHAAIDGLNRDYRRQGRPYSVHLHGNGYVLALRQRYRPLVDRLHGGTREAKLSQPAIDVLSLVAYRQPATKQEIDALRGAESGALLRLLVRHGLIAVVQRGDASTKEVSYGTTAKFLEMFGLGSLEDLPRTDDLRQI
jgi:segregation and condensation protein B